MLGNKKNVFWEAFFLTAVVFCFGLILGIAFEGSRVDKINEYYAESEISLMDILALNNMVDLEDATCEKLIKYNLDFADKIYEEAFLLERYDDSGKITDKIKLAHQKYDLLRTFLWINSIKIMQKCEGDFFSVVYLYEYESKDLTKKATQNVWSKILFDLKQKKGNEIVLIPIAVDNDLGSLGSLIEKFEISEFPVVIINNEYVVEELISVEDIEEYLN